jgi:hypothetical protein
MFSVRLAELLWSLPLGPIKICIAIVSSLNFLFSLRPSLLAKGKAEYTVCSEAG